MAEHVVVKIEEGTSRAWLANSYEMAKGMEEGIQDSVGGRTIIARLKKPATASTKAVVLNFGPSDWHLLAWPADSEEAAAGFAEGVRAMTSGDVKIVPLIRPTRDSEPVKTETRDKSPVRERVREPETAMFEGKLLPVYRDRAAHKICPVCKKGGVLVAECPGGLHLFAPCNMQYILK